MTTPAPPAKPAHPPTPAPAPAPVHAPPKKAAEDNPTPPLPIGAKPLNPDDPQAIKFDPPQPAPPRWEDKPPEPKVAPAWTPKPAIDPLAEKPPKGVYADGMPVADEQRARSAWIEEHGLEKYEEAIDQRQGDKPHFDKGALAGGGAFVSAGAQSQVPGVTPPTKRS